MANTKQVSPNKTYPTLANADILALYKSAGLSNRLKTPADYDWVRQHFGSDTSSLKKMLSQEAAKAPTAQQSPLVNPFNNQPYFSTLKTNTAPTQGFSSATNPVTPTQGFSSKNSNITPTAVDNYTPKDTTNTKSSTNLNGNSLIKFLDPNNPNGNSTIWLANSNDKSMRPFLNYDAFKAYYGNDEAKISEALQGVHEMSSQELEPGGQLATFTPLDQKYGITTTKDGGAIAPPLPFSPASIKQNYGTAGDPTKYAQASGVLSNWLQALKGYGYDAKFIDNIANDHLMMAGYANAMAFGGFSPEDISMDLKAKELSSQGQTQYDNVSMVSTSQNKAQFSQSAAYQSNYNNSSLANVDIRMKDFAQQNIDTIAKNPDSFYSQIDPGFNGVKNDKIKAEMDKVGSTIHDVILESLNAKTQEQKNYADQKWQNYKDDLNKNLGWQLSDNAMSAWNQLQYMQNVFTQRGLEGSGVEAEARNKYDTDVNRINQRDRDNKQTTEDRATRDNMMQNASPDDIKKMNDEDASKGLPRAQWRSVQWGLAPATAVTKDSWLADFKTKHANDPSIKDYSDQELIDMFYHQQYDDNGNLYSSMFDNKVNTETNLKYGSSINIHNMPQTSEELAKYNSAILTLYKQEQDKLKNTTPISMDPAQQYNQNGSTGNSLTNPWGAYGIPGHTGTSGVTGPKTNVPIPSYTGASIPKPASTTVPGPARASTPIAPAPTVPGPAGAPVSANPMFAAYLAKKKADADAAAKAAATTPASALGQGAYKPSTPIAPSKPVDAWGSPVGSSTSGGTVDAWGNPVVKSATATDPYAAARKKAMGL